MLPRCTLYHEIRTVTQRRAHQRGEKEERAADSVQRSVCPKTERRQQGSLR